MIWTFITSILTFPVRFFWKRYNECKEANKVGEMIMWFIISLSGVALFGLLLIYLVWYLLTKHLGMVIGGALILWLYAAVRDKYFPEQQSAPIENVSPNLKFLQEQAEKGYPVMRNILFQTLRDVAPDIGGRMPRLLEEIEMPECRYIIDENTCICFYQYRLLKADMGATYGENDRLEFQRILQGAISHKIQTGTFPSVRMEPTRYQYGELLDDVCVDVIEDIGHVLTIQTVFASPEYAEHRHQKRMNSQNGNGSTPNGFTTSWDDPQ